MEASPSANAHAGQCTDSASLPSFGSIIRVVFSLFERLVAMPQLIAATMLAIVAAIAVKLAPASRNQCVPTAGWYLLSHMPAPHRNSVRHCLFGCKSAQSRNDHSRAKCKRKLEASYSPFDR